MTCAVKTFDHTYTADDTLPEMVCVLEDTVLTGYTITMHLERPGTTVLDKTATDVDLANGKFKFVWAAGDLVAGYDQAASIEFDDGSGGVDTVSGLRINVEEVIA